MNPTIKQWLQVHTPTAQSFAGLWALLTILWETNSQFHDYIMGAFNALPKGVHALMVGAIIPILTLWRTQRKNVAVAEAAPGETGTASAKATVVGALLLSLVLMGGLMGCGAKASPPATAPTITEIYLKGASAMSDFSTDVRQAQAIEISLYRGGAIAKGTHQDVQRGFLSVGTYGKQIDALIAGQAGAATIQAKVSAALEALSTITVTTGALSPDAAAKLQASIQALTLILNNVTTIFNTQVSYGPRNRYGNLSGSNLAHDAVSAVQGATGSRQPARQVALRVAYAS